MQVVGTRDALEWGDHLLAAPELLPLLPVSEPPLRQGPSPPSLPCARVRACPLDMEPTLAHITLFELLDHPALPLLRGAAIEYCASPF